MSASARCLQAQRTSTCAERDVPHGLDHGTSANKLKSHGNGARRNWHQTSPYAADVAPLTSSEPLAAPSPSPKSSGPGDAALVKRRARHMSRAERLRERFFGKLLKEQSSMAVTERARDAIATPIHHRAHGIDTVGLSASSHLRHPSSPSRPSPTVPPRGATASCNHRPYRPFLWIDWPAEPTRDRPREGPKHLNHGVDPNDLSITIMQ